MVLPIKVLLKTDYTTACLPIFYDDKLLTENNLQIKEICEYQNFSLQFISNNTHDKFVVEDLADFQFENQKQRIGLKWGQDYFRKEKVKENEE